MKIQTGRPQHLRARPLSLFVSWLFESAKRRFEFAKGEGHGETGRSDLERAGEFMAGGGNEASMSEIEFRGRSAEAPLAD